MRQSAAAELSIAEDHAKAIDPSDTDLQNLAFAVVHCTRALIAQLDSKGDQRERRTSRATAQG